MSRTARHRRAAMALLWAAAAAVVLAAAVAQLDRPLAPDLGDLPPAEAYFDDGFIERAADYRDPRYPAAVARLLVPLIVAGLVALHPAGRRLAAAVAARAGGRRPALGAGVLLAVLLVAIDLATLPVDYWSGYVHEGRFGFRTQGLAGWARDWVIARLPGWLGALLLTPLVIRAVRRLPRAWPPLLGLGGGLLVAGLTLAGPIVLEPLWLDTTPLPPGPVRQEVERVLGTSGLAADRIVVGDASRRTTKANAYVSGLGATRRVVLYDTLLAEASAGEVGAVLAHELAHHGNGDLPRGVLLGTGGSVLLAAALWLGLRGAIGRGVVPPEPGPGWVPLALLLALVLSTASLPVQSLVSRRAEAAGDWGALELTRDPETYAGMQRALARSHLADPAPPWWVRTLWYTHPPVTARLEMARRWRQEHE